MRKMISLLALGFVIASVGCTTKRYHIAVEVSPEVAHMMTCRELEIELLKSRDIGRQINATDKFDTRAVLAFLGDLGIGNAMAREEAQTALDKRTDSIRTARLNKVCQE